jgi:hypothetical protein
VGEKDHALRARAEDAEDVEFADFLRHGRGISHFFAKAVLQ